MFVRNTLFGGLVLLGAVATSACVDYKFEQKCPEGITESEITVPAVEPSPADILFVVDNSGSMADEQQNLAENFTFFINQIAGSGDYQIAIVTTDQSTESTPNEPDPGEYGGYVDYVFDSGDYRVLRRDLSDLSSGCSAVGIEHGCFRGPTPGRRVIRSGTDTEQQVADFIANVDVGSCGSGVEQGLKSMVSALDKTRPGGCNEGFLREDANLVIIFVSDEEDTDNTPIAQYVQDVSRFKDPSKIRVAAIVGSVDGEPSRCNIADGASCGSLCATPPPAGSGTSCTNDDQCPADEYCDSSRRCENRALRHWLPENCGWCSYYNVEDCCSALAGSRYVQFARAIETRVVQSVAGYADWDCRAPVGESAACLVDSICQDSFGATLERIAKDLVIRNTYTLDPAPTNPVGVSVKVLGGRFGAEGKQLIYGDDFNISVAQDGSSAELAIFGENTPSQEGETLDVAYVSSIDRPTERRGACPIDTSSTAITAE